MQHCSMCTGTGLMDDGVVCSSCHGIGVVSATPLRCPTCDGKRDITITGTKVEPKPCKTCGDRGWVTITEPFTDPVRVYDARDVLAVIRNLPDTDGVDSTLLGIATGILIALSTNTDNGAQPGIQLNHLNEGSIVVTPSEMWHVVDGTGGVVIAELG